MVVGHHHRVSEDSRAEVLYVAYSAAWATRIAEQDDSFQILLDELVRHGLGEAFGSEGPGQDMMCRIWEKGVPPGKFKFAVRRELPRLALHGAKMLGGAFLEVARLFADSSTETVDLTWMDLPEGHLKLSDDRKAFDLVMRNFHDPVEELELDVMLTDPSKLLRDRNRLPSPNRRDAYEFSAWLRLTEPCPGAAVMVGEHLVGRTQLPASAWEDLKVEEARGVYADGRLFLPWTREEPTLQCVVPRRTT